MFSGRTFTFGPGSVPFTTTINGQIVTIGPKGIGFAGTTAALPRATGGGGTSSIVTADGLTFTVEPTDVVINGKTYAIGPGATPTTIVVGTETISIGPGGVGLPTTTIAPLPPGATGNGFEAFTGTSSAVLVPTFSVVLSTLFMGSFIVLLSWI